MSIKKNNVDDYIIKNKGLKLQDILRILSVLFFIYLLIFLEPLRINEVKGFLQSIFIVFLMIILILFIRISLRRIIDRNPKMILNKEGIQLIEEDIFIQWVDIKYITIDFTFANSDNEHIQIITNKEDTFLQDLKNLEHSNLKTAIQQLGGENLMQWKSEVLSLAVYFPLVDKEVLYEICKYCQKHIFFTKWIFLLVILLLGILQIVLTFPYVFATGFSCFTFVLLLLNNYPQSKATKNNKFGNIDTQLLNNITKQYLINKYGRDYSSKKEYIALIGFSLAIFLVSYFASIK